MAPDAIVAAKVVMDPFEQLIWFEFDAPRPKLGWDTGHPTCALKEAEGATPLERT